MSRVLYKNARLILPDSVTEGWLVTDGERIAEIGAGAVDASAFETVYDCRRLYLAPGFVEMHTHGAGGCDFMDGTAEAYTAACMLHLQHGTTTILPTTVAASKEEILRTIDGFSAVKDTLSANGPRLYGLHMEGPYLCKKQCGAIDPDFIRPPVPEEYEEFLSHKRGSIKRWTFAVENPGALRFAERLREEGILPSVGHSDAVYSQVLEAYEHGVTHATHLYSAMSGLTRRFGFRYPGVIESAYCIDGMTVEIIADGCHLPIEMLRLVYKAKGVEKTALVCDSIRAAGQDVKEFTMGGNESGRIAIVEDGVAKLPDRSAFAGSISMDDRLIRTMYHQAGIPLQDAIRMMTLTPASILGIGDRVGALKQGLLADLIVFDEDIRMQLVAVGGRVLVNNGIR